MFDSLKGDDLRARNCFLFQCAGQSNQRCFRRKRHHVKDESCGANQILWKGKLIGFSAARHANRRNVDEQSRFFRCELICPPKAVLLGKRGSRRLISRKDQAIGQSRVPQRAGDSFRHAAAALENEIDMRRNFTRFQELINGRVVCVVSSQVSVRVDDGIHGHDSLRRGVQFVQVLNTCLLERHGYRAAPDSQRTDSANRRGKISGGKSLVDKVQAQLAVEEVVESRPEVSRPRRERHAELGVFVDVAFHWRAVGVVSPSSCLFKALARTVSKLRRIRGVEKAFVKPFGSQSSRLFEYGINSPTHLDRFAGGDYSMVVAAKGWPRRSVRGSLLSFLMRGPMSSGAAPMPLRGHPSAHSG